MSQVLRSVRGCALPASSQTDRLMDAAFRGAYFHPLRPSTLKKVSSSANSLDTCRDAMLIGLPASSRTHGRERYVKRHRARSSSLTALLPSLLVRKLLSTFRRRLQPQPPRKDMPCCPRCVHILHLGPRTRLVCLRVGHPCCCSQRSPRDVSLRRGRERTRCRKRLRPCRLADVQR